MIHHQENSNRLAASGTADGWIFPDDYIDSDEICVTALPRPSSQKFMFDENASPITEEMFHRAYALSDPMPELLKLIKAHPTEAAVRDIVIYYIEAVEDNPPRAYESTSVVVALRESLDAPMIRGGFSLAEAFYIELHDLLPRGFDFDSDKDSRTFGPTNLYLIACLLSGLSFKYNLTSSKDQYGEIRRGLHAHDISSTSELLVIGACIQLLTSGSKIVPTGKPFIHSADEVAVQLKLQRYAGRVKESNAVKLLEVCQLFA